MDSVRKIVNCTPEQYLTLLKDGQVEVDGVVKTKEEGTLYNPGELTVLEWYNKFMEDIHKQYEIAHTPITTRSLEQEYEDIVSGDSNYQYVSAVGYRAVLENGDTVKVDGNNGHFFLNGERLTKDYIYSGEGTELVSVWVFESYDSGIALPPSLYDSPTFTPYEIDIRCIGQTPEVANMYYLYTSKISTYNYVLPAVPRACKTLIANGTSDFTQRCPVTVLEVYSDCEKVTAQTLSNNTYIKRIYLPEVREIIGTTIFRDLKSVTNWTFGKLQKIECSGNTPMFYTTNTVYIPNTVKTIIGVVCGGNTTVKLECNKANSIDTNWCKTTPTNFTMAKDWQASVNIAIAAMNWTKDKFIDLFENYLADLSSTENEDGTIIEITEAKELTIPQAIYDELTDEEFAIAENKNWIIGGA